MAPPLPDPPPPEVGFTTTSDDVGLCDNWIMVKFRFLGEFIKTFCEPLK
jgi:hypothetical protein